jgi:hypothetical protein
MLTRVRVGGNSEVFLGKSRTSFVERKLATTSKKPAMSLYHEAAGILDTVNKDFAEGGDFRKEDMED